MNKPELIDQIASHSGLTKADSGRALDGFISVIAETLKAGETVSLVGFGTFEAKQRAERQGRNPKTGEAITIPAARIPGFKPGKTLKELIG